MDLARWYLICCWESRQRVNYTKNVFLSTTVVCILEMSWPTELIKGSFWHIGRLRTLCVRAYVRVRTPKPAGALCRGDSVYAVELWSQAINWSIQPLNTVQVKTVNICHSALTLSSFRLPLSWRNFSFHIFHVACYYSQLVFTYLTWQECVINDSTTMSFHCTYIFIGRCCDYLASFQSLGYKC